MRSASDRDRCLSFDGLILVAGRAGGPPSPLPPVPVRSAAPRAELWEEHLQQC